MVMQERWYGRPLHIIDLRSRLWDIPTMIALMTDDKRRLTMPRELPPKSAVTIQQLDEDSWLVTRRDRKSVE